MVYWGSCRQRNGFLPAGLLAQSDESGKMSPLVILKSSCQSLLFVFDVWESLRFLFVCSIPAMSWRDVMSSMATGEKKKKNEKFITDPKSQESWLGCQPLTLTPRMSLWLQPFDPHGLYSPAECKDKKKNCSLVCVPQSNKQSDSSQASSSKSRKMCLLQVC